ncbi:MAG: 2-amino-4-hydroxy-6-hydroxymethyldihydropteridine diphosphokinase, partial [Desulfovibrionales bacterium]|nr:2-amino-4-hydroxy-6-hydroxymethyldihydropteridine diphosphokinase [Desulfovibrionales bacterium]
SKSSIYHTEPQDMLKQPWFINQVISIDLEEQITPTILLKFLNDIELNMGRLPGIPKGPRVIDLDILTFENKVISSQELTIPHPQMKKRAFVLIPLQEISPDFVFFDGETIDEALRKIQFRVEQNRIYQKMNT